MLKSIYVGNLPYTTSEDELRDMFGVHGTVHSVKLVTDRETGRPRGFGFVEMEQDAAQSAIDALNGKDIGGRPLRVNLAQEKPSRPPRPRR